MLVRRRDFEENHLAFAVILHAGDWLCTPWLPFSPCKGLRFTLISNEKVAHVTWQILHIAHVLHRCLHIKKDRLIVRVHGVERLVSWHERVDFGGGLFYLLPVL